MSYADLVSNLKQLPLPTWIRTVLTYQLNLSAGGGSHLGDNHGRIQTIGHLHECLSLNVAPHSLSSVCADIDRVSRPEVHDRQRSDWCSQLQLLSLVCLMIKLEAICCKHICDYRHMLRRSGQTQKGPYEPTQGHMNPFGPRFVLCYQTLPNLTKNPNQAKMTCPDLSTGCLGTQSRNPRLSNGCPGRQSLPERMSFCVVQQYRVF